MDCPCKTTSKARPAALAVGGVLLTGAGLSVFGEAVGRKNMPFSRVNEWLWLGALSVVMINAGICLIVEAAKQRDLLPPAGPDGDGA